ncbi:MAG: hypothetical protein A3J51_06820 [Omnitrophica WOR_2 bacterium RIFCSPHIGHO2_02_FULL_45_21]|nr:MAG: hypothetical protein A3J51_06820 [Omnitrophica WOR_2 bacterium RIFCSPHIGHO2_02_FULL_45_21]
MINVSQARKIILKNISPVKETELINLDSCSGRVSAVDIRAKENIPPFDNSAMDGFAVRAEDSAGAARENPRVFEVISDLAAGYTTAKKIGNNQAIRIMTGAPIPKGADSVVMAEDSQKVSSKRKEEFVRIFREVKKGENVRYAGEDVKKGEVVIRKGDILKSGYIGMLASLGVSKIKVYRKPKAAILATGDELVEINQRLVPGKIRNSNTYSLYAQAQRAGAVPVFLGIARDERKELEQKIRKGLRADMLLVSGGISVGDYDFVKDVLKKLGTTMKFWRVAMKPGKPLAFGMIDKIPIFGLPGNPVSSMVTFEQFVRPALLKMTGAKEIFRFHLPAIFREDFQKKMGLRYFLRVVLENKNGTLYASLTGPQGSGILKSMVLANGIMELPEELENLRPGDTAQVTYLD